MERHTLLLIKPDSTKKNHTGAILKIVEEHGFIIKELKMSQMDNETSSKFYAIHKGKDFYEKLLKFIQSGKTVQQFCSETMPSRNLENWLVRQITITPNQKQFAVSMENLLPEMLFMPQILWNMQKRKSKLFFLIFLINQQDENFSHKLRKLLYKISIHKYKKKRSSCSRHY